MSTTSADGVARRAGGLLLREVSVGTMDNRTYLLSTPDGASHLLVDAAAEPQRLLALLGDGGWARGLGLTVVTTHRHPDHTGALVDVLAATGAVHAAGEDDADHLPAPVDRRLADGDVVTVGGAGGVELGVIALRGHTPGSVALLLPALGPTAGRPRAAHLFTGDSLFPGGPGKTRSPADFTRLMDDLEQRVFGRLGDEVVVHPGHGEPTTLGGERGHLAAWRARGW